MTYADIEGVKRKLEQLLEGPPFKITFEGGGLPEACTLEPHLVRLINVQDLENAIAVLQQIVLEGPVTTGRA
jgi:hypothetical protein